MTENQTNSAGREATLPRLRLLVLTPSDYLASVRAIHTKALEIKETFSRRPVDAPLQLTEPTQKTL